METIGKSAVELNTKLLVEILASLRVLQKQLVLISVKPATLSEEKSRELLENINAMNRTAIDNIIERLRNEGLISEYSRTSDESQK